MAMLHLLCPDHTRLCPGEWALMNTLGIGILKSHSLISGHICDKHVSKIKWNKCTISICSHIWINRYLPWKQVKTMVGTKCDRHDEQWKGRFIWTTSFILFLTSPAACMKMIAWKLICHSQEQNVSQKKKRKRKSRCQWWVATGFKQKLLHLGELKILLLSPWNKPFCLPQILKMQTWICTFAWQNQRTPSIQSTSRKIRSRHIMHTGSSTAEPNRTDVSCI